MALNPAMFSSNKQDWGTPREFFERLHKEFHFTRDVCAHAQNAKLPDYWTTDHDALSRQWDGVCWMNPPYGRAVADFVLKAYEEAVAGRATTVCLVPARTDTRWWNESAIYADEIRFVQGRLRFEGDVPFSAPFPSVLVIFRKGQPKRPKHQIIAFAYPAKES